ncbi:carbohydrate-binding module family 1 protein [Thermothielavioides terrestris NRRL 8126]|uniref:Carbohydrate-binding module family 1 protein n=1 Tax=Thermothielavioides terrestris (strain ATCC 38088 / NRRL 8126) TaxID=578455 RepID=G2R7N0_THETT|nr:carbohydrate-binding module family 1 protein [Thermothielavioides terrestris NRRL 8126]AEO67939.1 carbohydrate-binding module family 1 protein [Thermothielavioides terrestris NRRL 8126]
MVRQQATSLLALAFLSVASAQVSNDFESGWDQTAWPTYAPDCNQGGKVTLDSTTAHSGKNSIRVDGAGGYCGHIFFGTSQVPSGDLYVRVYLKAANALTSSHVTFITMPDPAQGTNKHLRIGGQSQILMYNRESDDATLPDLSPQGIASSTALPTGSWQCFEYHIGTDGTIETWLNGAAIAGLEAGPGINNPYADQWERSSIKPTPAGVYFGWESYGGDTNTFWYDDIVISSSRVGCSGSTGTSPPATTTTPGGSTPPPATSTTTSTAPPATSSTPSCTAAHWAQCGGIGYTGCTTCASPYTCTALNDYYSQCL